MDNIYKKRKLQCQCIFDLLGDFFSWLVWGVFVVFVLLLGCLLGFFGFFGGCLKRLHILKQETLILELYLLSKQKHLLKASTLLKQEKNKAF